MKIRILGCGSSFGVPLIGNKFGKCDKNNLKNYRLRPSIIVYYKNKNILIDTSPDLRYQLLQANCQRINAVLYTHMHADHIHGINDLRSLSLISKIMIPAWGSKETMNYLEDNFSYIFKPSKLYEPIMYTNLISDNFKIDDIEVKSFQHNHGNIDCTTYRINNFAFVRSYFKTDDIGDRKKFRRTKNFIKKKLKDLLLDNRVAGLISALFLLGLPIYLGRQSGNPEFFGMYSTPLMLVIIVYILILILFSGLFIYLTFIKK